MYSLVADVETYPAFLSWCKGAVVHERGENEFQATLEFHRSGLSKAFTTHSRLVAGQRIDIQLLDGPFNHFGGRWHFEGLDGQRSEMRLEASFEFDSSVLDFLFGPALQDTIGGLVDAFYARAGQVYGVG